MTHSSANGPVRIVLRSDLKETRRFEREIVRQLEKTTAFERREVLSIRLALEEALVNAVRHGNRLDATKSIRIEYCIQPERFDISIADEGKGYDPDLVPDCKADANLQRPGGRGLFLIRHSMTSVVVEPPGNLLIMSKTKGTSEPRSS